MNIFSLVKDRFLGKSVPYLNSVQARKELAWVLAGQVFSMLGSLATLKILTTILPTHVYGEVNLIVIACTLPTLVLLAPITQSCYRYYAEHDEKGTLPSLLGTGIALQLSAVCLTGIGVGLGFSIGWWDRANIPPATILLGFGLFAMDAGRTICLTAAAAARKRMIVAFGFAVDAWLRPLFAMALVSFWGQRSSAAIGGYTLAGACTLIPLSLWLAKNMGGFTVKREILREFVRYGLPYGVWGIFGWAQAGADRYMVDHWLSRADVGRYVAGSQVGTFPFSVAGAFVGQLVSPVLFQRAGDGSDPGRARSAKNLLLTVVGLFLLFGGVALAFLYFLGPALLRLMTGRPEYEISRPVLMTIAVGGLLFQISQVCSSMFLIQKKSFLVLWPKILGGVTAVAVGLLAIPGWGLPGAAFSFACASAALLAGHWIGPARKAWRTVPVESKLGLGENETRA